MTTYTATYSPDDNKLRLYASQRLDAETFARVKAMGFRWAPKQELFVAPMWTPAREDLLEELAGEIGDEDSSLTSRAEERAGRFEDYSDKRAVESSHAAERVKQIADGIPLGQPILIGHHSERHARKDAQRIQSGMEKSVKLWRTSQYWIGRAAGALAHAKYKELPTVRARRIKTIEADRRKAVKESDRSKMFLDIWSNLEAHVNIKDPEAFAATHGRAPNLKDKAAYVIAREPYASACFTLAKFPRPAEATQYEGQIGYGEALAQDIITAEWLQAARIRRHTNLIAGRARWIEHYDNRLAYEKAMLNEQGASALLDKKPRRELAPLLNYRAVGGSITTANPYHRGESISYPQVEMTKAEYAKINGDYKGVRVGADKAHRFRTAMQKHALVAVFLTDSKEHPAPVAATAPAAHPAASIPDPRPMAQEYRAPRPERRDTPSDIAAMEQSLKAGVQVAVVNQLVPTPADLAARMAGLLDLAQGQEVLEPSAGTGNLCQAVLDAGGNVFAVEVNHNLAEALARRLGKAGTCTNLLQADFLACDTQTLGTYDKILMNPPFENGVDIKHIQHAQQFLKPGGRIVALCANGPRQNEKLKPYAESWEELPAGTFAGVNVRAALLVIQDHRAAVEDHRAVA